MKTDRTALLWGTVIAVSFVVVTMVVVFKFPDFRLPFAVKHGAAITASVALFFILTASYRKLWKHPGYWVLLCVFIGMYWFVVVYAGEMFVGIRMDVLYGITGAVEAAIFGLIMARVYHRGPDISSFTGRRAD